MAVSKSNKASVALILLEVAACIINRLRGNIDRNAFDFCLMSTWTTVAWNDIAYLADRAFEWGVGSGLTWAELMWKHLDKVHLTRYQTVLERCQIKIYVMALADFYNQFGWVAYQEPQNEEYYDWAEALELSEFRIGQLMGYDPDFEADEAHTVSLTNAALCSLIPKAIERILPVISEATGGPLGLLKTLYFCSRDYDDLASPEQISIDFTPENMEVYAWIDRQISATSSARKSGALPKNKASSKAASLETVQLSLITLD